MYEYIDAEESLISCLMSRLSCMEDIYGMLSPDMFDSGICGALFYEYSKAYEEKKEITLTELHQAVAAAGYQDYEITEAIKKCAGQRAMAFQAKGYATTILNHYKKTCVERVLERVELKDATVDEQIDGIIEQLDVLRSGKPSEGHTVADIAKQHSEDYFCDKDKKLVLLGDEEIDNLTGGFQGGDIILLGARPGCGKSAMAMQWAWRFADQGYKVGYYNCEMQEESVLERLISSKSGISTTRIRLAKAFLNDEEEKYRKAVSELSEQDKIIVFSGTKTVSDIRNDMRKNNFGVIIVDYLQLLSVGDRYRGNRVAEVGELSRSLKEVAMQFSVPIIALSQLSRASEGRNTREPQLFDLRESGSLEQDASIVFFLWDLDETDRSKKGFKTSKSRNGICGRYDLIFDGASMTFRSENNVTPFD